MTAREQARKAVIAKVCPDDYDDRYLPKRLEDAADVTSDIWERLLRNLIRAVHAQGTGGWAPWMLEVYDQAIKALPE